MHAMALATAEGATEPETRASMTTQTKLPYDRLTEARALVIVAALFGGFFYYDYLQDRERERASQEMFRTLLEQCAQKTDR